MRSLLLTEDMFPVVEKLHLSYNNIPVSHLQNLKHLRNLQMLDLSANDLVTLPEDLSFLSSVEDLNLSSNQFNSESTLVRPEKIFASLGMMPRLKRLNLGRNRFTRFHYEELQNRHFPALQELDFGYNFVQHENDLMYTEQLRNLLVLTITGNPFALKSPVLYENLEKNLATKLSAVIINRADFSKKTK